MADLEHDRITLVEEQAVHMLAQNKPISEIANHLDRAESYITGELFKCWVLDKYRAFKASQFWRQFEVKYENVADKDLVDINKLKRGQTVYIKLQDEEECINKFECLGWMKSKVTKIWKSHMLEVDIDGCVRSFEFDEIQMASSGATLYYYNFVQNNICPVTTARAQQYNGEYRVYQDHRYDIVCECGGVMPIHQIKDICNIDETVECNKCEKEYKARWYNIWLCTDNENSVHSEVFFLCTKCATRYISAKLCTEYMQIEFDRFDIAIMERKNKNNAEMNEEMAVETDINTNNKEVNMERKKEDEISTEIRNNNKNNVKKRHLLEMDDGNEEQQTENNEPQTKRRKIDANDAQIKAKEDNNSGEQKKGNDNVNADKPDADLELKALKMSMEEKDDDSDEVQQMNSFIYDASENDNNMNVSQPTLSDIDKVKAWLTNECKLPSYYDLFIENGIDRMDIVELLSMNELEQLNVKLGHRIKIMSEINKLISMYL